MKKKFYSRSLLLIVLFFLFLSVVHFFLFKKHDIKKDEQILVWGTVNPPTIINPILTQYSVSSSLMGLIFDSLFRLDANGEAQYGLVEQVNISTDRLGYVFRLKKGVKFHDGHELTAEDVKFTYDLAADPQNKSPWRTNVELIDRWDVLGPYTIKMTLKKPFDIILRKLIQEILPKHLWEKENIFETGLNYAPVGSGPFILKEWDRDKGKITLGANLNYFDGKPRLEKIVVKTFNDDEDLWVALMRQEVDLSLFLNYKNYDILRKDPSFKTYRFSWKTYCAIAYDPQNAIFYDKEVRHAVAEAIDVKTLIRESGIGGVISTGPFHPESAAYNSEIQAIAHDPVKAKIDLINRGWKEKNGVLEKGGMKLEMNLMVDERIASFKKIAMIIRQQLAQVGIKVSVCFYNGGQDLTKENFTKKKTQAWLRFYGGTYFQKSGGYEALANWYSSTSEYGRIWSYRNEEVDRLFKEARSTKDLAKQKKAYQEAHRIIYEDQPVCFLFFPETYHAVSARVQNAEGFFNDFMPIRDMADWWIAKE